MLFAWSTLFVLITISKQTYGDEEYKEFSTIVAHSNGTESESTDAHISTIQPEFNAVPFNNPKIPLVNRSPLDNFPDDFFTDKERSSGAVIFHILCAIYFFALLAIVCNDYFLPSVECVCEDLNISKDVAAASFMATATIAPEFFTNVISTFVVDSEVGLGGVLGSLMFNVLGVAAFAGLAATNYVQLDWWPITRDCSLYALSVSVLILFTRDGQISFIESTIMISLVLIYFLVFLFNKHLMHCVKWFMEINLNLCRVTSYDMPTSFVESNLKDAISLQPDDLRKMANIEEKPKTLHGSLSKSALNDMTIFMIYMNPALETSKDDTERKLEKSLWNCPMTGKLNTLWFIYTWPIKFLLTLTIPNPKTFRCAYPLTFIISIVWIGLNSYMIVWMMTIIGYTFRIPEAVMGMTFLAAGNCTPEALSSILMIRKGERGIGVSNSLGSSTLDIFLSLGVPWFVRNLLQWYNSNPNPSVLLESSGTGPTILLLLASVFLLYVILSIAKYRLTKLVGLSLFLGYTILAILSVSLEMNILVFTS
ncbi:sodium/potassium/calcium exchanger 3-like [Contarinia nasturtii]|uniref:sodium/potassium/calcium exchanger 3-like n=1 Tax=Contarinia nasturtii TaxID=265458 RepID=UPI0012D3C67C|nr:sodium/potassium/calcium exchanger 3-like [Contarinia nasturtii]